MNSRQGYKGFITFLILSAVLLVSFFGVKYILRPDGRGETSSDTRGRSYIIDNKSSSSSNDFSGITNPVTDISHGIKLPQPVFSRYLNGAKGSEDNGGVLGVNTNLANEMIVNDFKEAMMFGDTRYDFNKDGQVTNLDYPLFIEFIMSRGE